MSFPAAHVYGYLYERTQNPKHRYFRNLVKISKPEFFVFYNGEEDYPVEKILKLSRAFLPGDGPRGWDVSLELIVKMRQLGGLTFTSRRAMVKDEI